MSEPDRASQYCAQISSVPDEVHLIRSLRRACNESRQGSVRWSFGKWLRKAAASFRTKSTWPHAKSPTKRSLMGRHALEAWLSEELCARAILIISLEALSGINRVFGYDTGDRTLMILSERLRTICPEGTLLAKLGGAKFAMAFEANCPGQAEAVGHVIREVMARTFDGEYDPAARIGVAWRPAGISSANASGSMISAALEALDRGKRQGALVSCASISKNGGTDELALSRAAFTAVRAGSCILALQPIVAADSARQLFQEALARVRLPCGTLIPAGTFMPVLDRLGISGCVDLSMLRLAFQELERNPCLRLSVNISGASVNRPEWTNEFHKLATGAPHAAARLILEVTEETVMTNMESARSLFSAVRSYGTALALDDFGAGRTSFGHLRDIRFDILKIDGGFIRGIDESADNQMLVSALVAVGRQFDMLVIAERVESDAEANTLRGLGVDGLQGYLFARPHFVSP